MYDHIIKPLFGIEWCGQASVLSSSITFNSMVSNKRWVLFNEVFGGSSNKYSNKTLLANTAKMYIGREAEFIINEKHKAERLYKNMANYIFFSNEFSPMMIENSNRRFIVSETGLPLKERVEDIGFLLAQVKEELPAFAQYLKEYPCDYKKYNLKFETKAEQVLIEDTMGKFQAFYINLFNKDWLRERVDERLVPHEVLSLLNKDYERLPASSAYLLYSAIFGDEVTTRHTFLTRMRSMGAAMTSEILGTGRMIQFFTKE
jgi:hypothetical protein